MVPIKSLCFCDLLGRGEGLSLPEIGLGQGDEFLEQYTTRSTVEAPPTDLRENQEAVHPLVEKLAGRPGAGRYGRDAGRKNRPDVLAAGRRSLVEK